MIRQRVASTLPRTPATAKVIVVVGTPRSGTSWLARSLSNAGRCIYFYEPDRELIERDINSAFPYYLKDERNPEFRETIEKMIAGEYRRDRHLWHNSFPRLLQLPFASTVLLKWVWLGTCLEWVSHQFPDVRIVRLIRHPVSQFLSWQERGWSPENHLTRFASSERLMDGPLREYHDIVANSSGFWQSAAVFWCITNLLQSRCEKDRCLMREHEWYLDNPIRRMKWLFGELGLAWNESCAVGLSEDPHRKGVSKFGARPWREGISRRDLAVVRRVTDVFQLPFYPGLDDSKFWSAE